MPGNESVIGEEGLRFFGKMSASISHELKNALSIINEGAGLLEDLAALAAKGVALDPQRLLPLGEKIRRQVKRADLIIQRMNRFAHTIDARKGEVDLNLMLQQLCELAERFAAMQNVVIEVVAPDGPAAVVSAPFLLQNVVWLCLDFAIQSIGPGGRLRLQAVKTDSGGHILLHSASGLSRSALDKFLSHERRTALLEGLDAELTVNEPEQMLCIALPKTIEDR